MTLWLRKLAEKKSKKLDSRRPVIRWRKPRDHEKVYGDYNIAIRNQRWQENSKLNPRWREHKSKMVKTRSKITDRKQDDENQNQDSGNHVIIRKSKEVKTSDQN